MSESWIDYYDPQDGRAPKAFKIDHKPTRSTANMVENIYNGKLTFAAASENDCIATGIREWMYEFSPTDEIVIDYETVMQFGKLWGAQDGAFIPADLIISNTVPLKKAKYRIFNNGKDCLFWIETIDIEDTNEAFGVLNLILEGENGGVSVLLFIEDGYITTGSELYFSSKKLGTYAKELISDNVNFFECQFGTCLGFWYSIQIAMLHPQMKTVFATSKLKPIEKPVRNSKHKPKKRKVTYVRQRVVKAEDVNAVQREIKRNCLAWYVIGHWREYKSGKRIFIQGFWKGALRETKANQDLGRNRLIESEADICQSLKPALPDM